MRSMRDSPAPFSMTSSGAAMPRSASHWVTTVRDASRVAELSRLALRSRNSCRAITLLLFLLMSRTTSSSVGESIPANATDPGATVPSRTLPAKLPPSWRHRWSNSALA